MKTLKQCAPGKHDRKPTKIKVNYKHKRKLYPLVISICKACGMWRWARQYMGGEMRGPYSKYQTAVSLPAEVALALVRNVVRRKARKVA